ncbi:hypothetical protein ACQKDD_17050 [Planococcus kocurii]|uniref:hypothetical protein n=1 Tax=Planococcus kocurii TaxID=1374 RepID=UPI003D052FF7
MTNQFVPPIEIEEQLEDNMKIITTIFSPALSDIGILLAGENYYEQAKQVAIQVYLLGNEKGKWFIQGELQAFIFSSFSSAQRFIDNLPSMSALDLMLIMSGYGSKSHHPIFFQ